MAQRASIVALFVVGMSAAVLHVRQVNAELGMHPPELTREAAHYQDQIIVGLDKQRDV